MNPKAKQFTSHGIVLRRTNYGEADRIITFITPQHGKLSALAKSVRKQKSKLAGGIELFSISELSFIAGKSNINTLISSRLVKYYGNIVKNLDRTNTGYEFIKILNKVTEDNPEEAYYNLLNQAFAGLDDTALPLELVLLWFNLQLLKLAGHSPNLHTDLAGDKLEGKHTYNFNYDQMCFSAQNGNGAFTPDHIKFLRLGFGAARPQILGRVQSGEALAAQLAALVKTMLQAHLRL